MKYETSCGAIVLNNDKVLLIKHNLGHIDFPKGHVEIGETKQETAIREVKEETNIDIKIDNNNEYKITYSPKEGVMKDVIFFRATPLSFDAKNQEEEVSEVIWSPIKEALNLITHDDAKKLFKEFLESENINYE